jgi:hypothetical protein
MHPNYPIPAVLAVLAGLHALAQNNLNPGNFRKKIRRADENPPRFPK